MKNWNLITMVDSLFLKGFCKKGSSFLPLFGLNLQANLAWNYHLTLHIPFHGKSTQLFIRIWITCYSNGFLSTFSLYPKRRLVIFAIKSLIEWVYWIQWHHTHSLTDKRIQSTLKRCLNHGRHLLMVHQRIIVETSL